MSAPLVRTFRSGDEIKLVDLANRAYRPFGGHVPRTVEGWRWSILARPGIVPEDILIGEDDAGRTLGFGVLDTGGTVLEFCLEPAASAAERQAAARRLVAALEDRCRERNLETITFEVPGSDRQVHEALTAEGYRSEESSSLQVILVDVAEAVRRILGHRLARLRRGLGSTFVLELSPGNYRPHPTLRLLVAAMDGRLTVEENPPPDVERDVTIEIDLSTLTDLILRRESFDEARGSGRITVHPEAALADARTLCEWLGLRSTWYTPPADGR